MLRNCWRKPCYIWPLPMFGWIFWTIWRLNASLPLTFYINKSGGSEEWDWLGRFQIPPETFHDSMAFQNSVSGALRKRLLFPILSTNCWKFKTSFISSISWRRWSLLSGACAVREARPPQEKTNPDEMNKVTGKVTSEASSRDLINSALNHLSSNLEWYR